MVLFRTREKETNERRHKMKATETAVQFYKEKVIYCILMSLSFFSFVDWMLGS